MVGQRSELSVVIRCCQQEEFVPLSVGKEATRVMRSPQGNAWFGSPCKLPNARRKREFKDRKWHHNGKQKNHYNAPSLVGAFWKSPNTCCCQAHFYARFSVMTPAKRPL